MIYYLTRIACEELIFPIIGRHMASHEPAPKYHLERAGMDKLNSILELMASEHYPNLRAKAAYMFCSIIDGHPFSNGNKRLAVALLSYFLLVNSCSIEAEPIEKLRAELKLLFPHLQWHEVKSFRYPHEYFLYYLALVIADRNQKGSITFEEERRAVETALEIIFEFPVS